MKHLIALLLLAGSVTTSAFGAEGPRKLNVLFISVDDMNNDLGCYGSPIVKTPGIDRLAARGVKFDRAYCQYPLCSPSRTSIMTGLRPDTTRVFDLQLHFRKTVPDAVTLGELFKNDGYYAARVGKVYHYGNPGQIGTNGLDDAHTWNHRVNPAGVDKTKLEPRITNLTPGRGLGSSLSFLSDPDHADTEHTDGMVATEVIKLLEQNQDKPFFIAAGFYRPHCPYVAPKQYFDLYPLDQIRFPDEPAEHIKQIPEPALGSTKPWPLFGVDPEEARRAKQAYYASISFVDAQINRLLDAMDRLKLWENTVVVFWSDHGYHVGNHGLWKKQSLFETSARVPMVIAAPGKSAGKVAMQPVELVDLYPTLADLAGIKAPTSVEGKSLRPLLENVSAEWSHPAYTQVRRGGQIVGRSVRTDRWRYTEWDAGKAGVQLYDMQADPHEFTNLATSAEHAQTLKQMKTLLEKEPAKGFAQQRALEGKDKPATKPGKPGKPRNKAQKKPAVQQ